MVGGFLIATDMEKPVRSAAARPTTTIFNGSP